MYVDKTFRLLKNSRIEHSQLMKEISMGRIVHAKTSKARTCFEEALDEQSTEPEKSAVFLRHLSSCPDSLGLKRKIIQSFADAVGQTTALTQAIAAGRKTVSDENLIDYFFTNWLSSGSQPVENWKKVLKTFKEVRPDAFAEIDGRMQMIRITLVNLET